MPQDSPEWLQPFHLGFYGGFVNEWERFETDEGHPFWYSSRRNKSTWDNPVGILSALVSEGIESNTKTEVDSWESIEGTPFIKISMKNKGKPLYYHRMQKVTLLSLTPREYSFRIPSNSSHKLLQKKRKRSNLSNRNKNSQTPR